MPLQEFGLGGFPFLLKIGTNKLNIHSSGNLSMNKILLNMFVKDFKDLSPPALNNSKQPPEGPLAFLSTIHCTPHLFNLNSLHCTLYFTSVNTIIPFIFNINFPICSFQIFFQSSTLTFTALLSSLRQLTPTASLFTPTLCLAILNNSQPSKHKSTFSTTSQSF